MLGPGKLRLPSNGVCTCTSASCSERQEGESWELQRLRRVRDRRRNERASTPPLSAETLLSLLGEADYGQCEVTSTALFSASPPSSRERRCYCSLALLPSHLVLPRLPAAAL
jgi:hypothetical protein